MLLNFDNMFLEGLHTQNSSTVHLIRTNLCLCKNHRCPLRYKNWWSNYHSYIDYRLSSLSQAPRSSNIRKYHNWDLKHPDSNR